MSPTSSLRSSALIGAGSFSSRSCSCSTMTSLAFVNNRWLEGIVRSQQVGETEQSVPAQLRLLGDLHLAGGGREHPQRDLQRPPRRVDDRDCTVVPLRSTDDSQAHAMTGVKGIEDLNACGFLAQGIVGASGCIRMFIV